MVIHVWTHPLTAGPVVAVTEMFFYTREIFIKLIFKQNKTDNKEYTKVY